MTKKTVIESAIESLLFFSGDAIDVSRLAEIIECDEQDIQLAVENLNKGYMESSSGIEIKQITDSYQMCTVPNSSIVIERFLQKPIKKHITQPILETLAIVAYSQPITKVQIEDIRGVRSDHTISKLIEYNLICEIGRLDIIGKPILFGTTGEFLRHFGFKSIEEIPKVKEELIERFRLEAQQEIDFYE